ncbi:hypothetical protein PIB30_081211 [Stylosanthes scabra]|uniref:Uncharacterized protein n=1 Tax=Stylosanthes scabra TaxID=79078 RepID=A0ABU6SSB2_9FABA|nr:hypothetical protein [Stylosanthes scabra]
MKQVLSASPSLHFPGKISHYTFAVRLTILVDAAKCIALLAMGGRCAFLRGCCYKWECVLVLLSVGVRSSNKTVDCATIMVGFDGMISIMLDGRWKCCVSYHRKSYASFFSSAAAVVLRSQAAFFLFLQHGISR